MYCRVQKEEIYFDTRAFPPRDEKEFWEDLCRIREHSISFNNISGRILYNVQRPVDLLRMRLCS